jgi:hypothetical protein
MGAITILCDRRSLAPDRLQIVDAVCTLCRNHSPGGRFRNPRTELKEEGAAENALPSYEPKPREEVN